MGVTLEQSETQCLVHLDGEVNIASAAELKKALMEALGSGKELRVELEHASELDVTALQLLCAAERQARVNGRGFALAGKVPEEIYAEARDAGFEKFPVPVSPK